MRNDNPCRIENAGVFEYFRTNPEFKTAFGNEIDSIAQVEDLVTMQIELPSPAGELLRSNAPYEFHLVPVALRGRAIPTAPLRLRSVKISPVN